MYSRTCPSCSGLSAGPSYDSVQVPVAWSTPRSYGRGSSASTARNAASMRCNAGAFLAMVRAEFGAQLLHRAEEEPAGRSVGGDPGVVQADEIRPAVARMRRLRGVTTLDEALDREGHGRRLHPGPARDLRRCRRSESPQQRVQAEVVATELTRLEGVVDERRHRVHDQPHVEQERHRRSAFRHGHDSTISQ